MGREAKFTGQSNVVIFAETTDGVFGATIQSSGFSVLVESSADTMTAVAVATREGQAVASWSSYYGVASGWVQGPVLELGKVNQTPSNSNSPASPSYAYSGPYVTVVDAGTHLGTPTAEKQKVIYSSTKSKTGVVGLLHVSPPGGSVFKGWRVAFAPMYATTKTLAEAVSFLSGDGKTDGLETIVSAMSLGGGALVVAVKESPSSYDVLTFEALYATSCTVSFASNAPEADFSGPTIPDISVPIGSSATLPDPAHWTRDGYAFAAWNTEADGSGESYAASATFPAPAAAAVTLYALWTKAGGKGAEYQFDPASGGAGVWPKQYATHYPYIFVLSADGAGGAAITLDVMYGTTAGHRTYRKNLDNGTVYENSRTEQGEPSLRQFALPCTISYPSGMRMYTGSENRYGTSSAQPNGTMSISETWLFPQDNWTWAAPDVEGYEFEGWYTLDAVRDARPSTPQLTTLVSRDQIVTWKTVRLNANYAEKYYNYLHARYRGRALEVVFQPCGGACAEFRKEVRHGETYGALPAASRTGFTFLGWAMTREGGETISADDVVSAVADHVLYAQWSEEQISVTFALEACGGTVSPESLTVTSGEPYGELPTPTREGYEFMGWFTASLGGAQVTAESVVSGGAVRCLYAQWAAPEPDTPQGGGEAVWTTITIG